MGRGPSKKGEEARRRILAELARRWEEVEPPVSGEALAELLGLSYGNLRFHADRLRIEGLIHADSLWITRAGIAHLKAHTH